MKKILLRLSYMFAKGGVCGRQEKQINTKGETGGGGEMYCNLFRPGPLTATFFFLFCHL